MLWCTDILRPPPSRIARLGQNFTLPVSVPVPQFVGGCVGAIVGVIPFLLIKGLGVDPIGAFIFGVLGTAGIAVGVVSWRPWRGENVGKVAWVRVTAIRRTRRFACPGSGMAAVHSEALEAEVCSMCGAVVRISEELCGAHEWRRRIYVGAREVVHPRVGAIHYRSGSIPVGDGDAEDTSTGVPTTPQALSAVGADPRLVT